LFNKILSSIGIGAAKVDLVLQGNKYRAGEPIEGSLKVQSGAVEQEINKIYLQLVVRSKFKKGDDVKEVSKELDHAILSEGFTVTADEQEREIPVSYILPEDIPISTGATQAFLATGMDISRALDPRDNDPVEILPGQRQQVVMNALEKELGFRKKRGTGAFNGQYQEFEYRPGKFLQGKLDELEVIYQVREDGIGLIMQIDKKSGGLLGGLLDDLDMDERNAAFLLKNHQITTAAEVSELLARFIQQEYQKIM